MLPCMKMVPGEGTLRLGERGEEEQCDEGEWLHDWSVSIPRSDPTPPPGGYPSLTFLE